MKKLHFTLLVLLSSFNTHLYSQSGWYRQPSGVTVKLNKVFFIDAQTGWTVGDSGKILKTVNAGENWIPQNSNTNHTLRSVFFTDNLTGFVAGGNYTPNSFSFPKILKTINGGNTWFLVFDLIDFYRSLSDVYFINSNTGYAIAFGGNESKTLGTILKTTNAGIDWISNVWESSSSIQFTDHNTGWITSNVFLDVGGDSLFIFKTGDSGFNWDKIYSSPRGRLTSSIFLNNSTGWVAGLKNVSGFNIDLILKTTDAGMNWENLNLTTTSFINSIFFTSYDTGWYCSSGIFKSINSGSNWNNQIPSNGNDYYTSITFLDNSTGWTVGSNGIILKTITGGLTSVTSANENIPNDFSLSQNYPNPFNPKTIINYEIPSNVNGQMSNVKLVVYNALGKEVAILVNENQNAGSYSVEWNGTNYSSGIYFYKITTENFSEIKKMTLLK